MGVMFFIKLSLIMNYLQLSGATWTLTGSSSSGVVGESFTLTCTPDTSTWAFRWKRNGDVVAIVETGCTLGAGSDTSYTYTCGNGNVRILTIPASSMTSSQDNTVWKCEDAISGNQAEYTLYVQKPVSGITLQQLDTGYPDVPVVYENEVKTFSCVTSPCYPRASVTVTHTVSGASVQINDDTSSPVNGLYVTSRRFTVTPTRGDHGKTVTCIAVNIPGRQPVTQTVTLDVYYAPTITLDATAIVVEEGSSVIRMCSATGYPTPVVNWYNGDRALTSGNGTTASLLFSNIDRSHTDTYTCKAVSVNATYKTLKSEAPVSVIVQYPPVAQVHVPSSVAENDNNVEIICDVTNGVPATNIFYGWSQSIVGTVIRSGLSGTADGNNNKLLFSSVSFDDIGDYKCDVGNGIKGRQPNVIQSVSAYFNVKVSAKFNSNDRRKAAEQNKDTTLSFPFYSNPSALSVNDIKWTNESNGAVLTSSNSISFDLINANVEKSIHGKTVSLDGQIVSITFKPFLSYYVGNYTIDVTNGGTLTSSFRFEISASAPPDKPINFGVLERTANSVTLTWTAGFNGGHSQTFVVRYSKSSIITEETIEEKPSQNNYTYTVDQLNPSTKYQFWLFAKNVKGNSSLFSATPLEAMSNEAVSANPLTDSNGEAVAGGVAGTLVVVIAAVVIVIGVMFYRRRHDPRKSKSSDTQTTSTQEYADLQSDRDGNPYDRCNDMTNTNVYENQGLTHTQENKYEDLTRTTESNTYEGIHLSDNDPAEKVYYVNTQLRS